MADERDDGQHDSENDKEEAKIVQTTHLSVMKVQVGTVNDRWRPNGSVATRAYRLIRPVAKV